MLSPEKHTFDTIWGHEAARRFAPRLMAAGRLPHAILLTGSPAIGKRSLAFAMAKAILSAGRPAEEASLNAPGPAPAKRDIGEPGNSDDLFGDAFDDDLFGGQEADLFGAEEPAAAEPDPEPEPEPEQQKSNTPSPIPADPPSREPKPAPKLRKAPKLRRAEFTGFNERVCRLVEKSYPVSYDKDGRPESFGHVDLSIVEPAKGRRGIVVDQIRYLQDIAPVAPVEGAFRVIMIFGADRITQEAGNSILKLLEEPPSYLIMILVADRLSQVLPTIKSRCSIVPMAPLEPGILISKLVEQENLSPERARVAAALSECRPGAALAALGKKLLDRRQQVFQARLQIDRYGVPAIPGAVSRMGGPRDDLEEALWLLISFARDRMVYAVAPEKESLLVHGDAPELIGGVEPDLVGLIEEAERLIDAYHQLSHPYVPNKKALLQTALWSDSN